MVVCSHPDSCGIRFEDKEHERSTRSYHLMCHTYLPWIRKVLPLFVKYNGCYYYYFLDHLVNQNQNFGVLVESDEHLK